MSVGAADANFQNALAAAHARFRERDLAGAATATDALLLHRPGQPDVLHLRAIIYRESGDLAGARDSLEQAVTIGGTAEMLNTLANILDALGDTDAAEARLDAATALDPTYAPAWINRARIATRRGWHDEAIAWAETGAQLQPRSVLARTTLAEALRGGGESERAVSVATEAIAIDPARPTSHIHRGLALTAAGRPMEALRAYDAAERLGDARPQLDDNRAAAFIAAGRLDAALDRFDRLTKNHPGYLGAHFGRARLIVNYGLDEDPFASFSRTAAQWPSEPAIWRAWLGALTSFRRYPEAVEITDRAVAAIGLDPAILFARATALGEAGAHEAASTAFNALVAEDCADPARLAGHARHLLRVGDPSRAAERAGRAVDIAPDDQFGWAYLGTAWRLLGDAREHWLNDYAAHVGLIDAVPPDGSESAVAFAERAAETLRALHLARHHPPEQSLRNGTQTEGALFASGDPVIRGLRAAVEHAVAGFVARLPDDARHPFLLRKAARVRFAGSWSVRLTRDGYHINHVHPKGWISSAYYVALPADTAGDEGCLALGAPPQDLGMDLGPRRVVRPRVGMIALFPSFMWHGTLPFHSGDERLTAAFDMVPT